MKPDDIIFDDYITNNTRKKYRPFHLDNWDNISDNYLLQIITNNEYVIFFSIHESRGINEFIEKILSLENNILCEVLILSNDKKCKQIETNKINIKYVPFLLQFFAKVNKVSQGMEYDQFFDSKSKIFLITNKNCLSWKPHRLKFLSCMNKEDLLDMSFFSCLMLDDIEQYDDNFWSTNKAGLRELKKYSTYFFDKYPIVLDWNYIDDGDDRVENDVDYHYINYYKKSFFTIVSESTFSNQSCILTEKTFKPIHNHHPFIIVGDYGIHSLLTELGFYLYDDIIDYSFDEIKDNDERMFSLSNEVKRLSTIPQTEIYTWYQKNKDKIQYNQKHIKKFQKKYEIT